MIRYVCSISQRWSWLTLNLCNEAFCHSSSMWSWVPADHLRNSRRRQCHQTWHSVTEAVCQSQEDLKQRENLIHPFLTLSSISRGYLQWEYCYVLMLGHNARGHLHKGQKVFWLFDLSWFIWTWKSMILWLRGSGGSHTGGYLRDTNVIKGLFITLSVGGLTRSLTWLESWSRSTGKPSSWNFSSVISVTGASGISSYSDSFQLERNSKFGSFC